MIVTVIIAFAIEIFNSRVDILEKDIGVFGAVFTILEI